MPFIDCHLHGFFSRQNQKLIQEYFAALKERSLDKAFLIIKGDFGTGLETIVKYSAWFTQPLQNQENYLALPHLATWQAFAREFGHEKSILYFLDVRWLRGEVEALAPFLPFIRGLKIFYAPPEAREGLEYPDYLRRDLLQFARRHHLPLLIHVETNRFHEQIKRALADCPDLNFVLCHFGYSRRHTADLLNSFPNAYTDLSSMLPEMARNREGYRSFILEHQDRVLFGTDHLLGGPRPLPATEYLDFFLGLGLTAPVEEKVLYQNAYRFLGQAG